MKLITVMVAPLEECFPRHWCNIRLPFQALFQRLLSDCFLPSSPANWVTSLAPATACELNVSQDTRPNHPPGL